MPELRIQIPDALDAKIEAAMPEYLDRKGFLCLLIDQALDSPVTLGVQSAAGTPSSSNTLTSIPKSINNKSKSKGRKEGRKRQEYPEAFETFWKGYQQLPEKASKQSKPLALVAWEEACELHPADELQRAVDRQLEIQQEELRSARGFTVAMPDCFRWLRDECFVALLEGHTPAQEHRTVYL
jgi:hypothetical protein